MACSGTALAFCIRGIKAILNKDMVRPSFKAVALVQKRHIFGSICIYFSSPLKMV
jgi:hypothetical protein